MSAIFKRIPSESNKKKAELLIAVEMSVKELQLLLLLICVLAMMNVVHPPGLDNFIDWIKPFMGHK